MANFWHLLHQAKALHSAGQLDGAVALYHQVLDAQSTNVDALFLLGQAYHVMGKLEDAVACLEQTVNLAPRSAEAHNYLGALSAQQGKLQEAESSYRAAIKEDPKYVPAHGNLATVLHQQGKPEEAVIYCRRGLVLAPNSAELHCNLGAFLTNLGRCDEAVASCRRALALKPDYVEAYYNLSRALVDQGNLDEAAACCRRAIELRPDAAEAQGNLAFVLMKQHKPAETAACLQRLLTLTPDDVEAHFTYSQVLLQLGRFSEAWPEYEWRLKRPGQQETLPEPRWDGSPLSGRTILLLSEQGLGDDLQFIRYAELVKQQGATVLVGCRRPVARLLATCPGVDSVAVVGEPVPHFDLYVPLPSLPRIFRTSLDTIPCRVPYVAPDAQLISSWARELEPDRSFKIGIAWQGSPTNPSDLQRSIPLAHFAGIAKMLGVRLYSLQIGPGREQLDEFAGAWPITDLGNRLGDFYNTAAIVRNLDLVITCDSAPAHLAGALAMPVWVALPFVADWRWMLERADSPWYPTMRLFRQTSPRDWPGVFRRIEDSLAAVVAAR